MGRRNFKHNPFVEAELTPLLPLYARERAASRPLALAVVVRTQGSTYRKPGALMAIATDGSYAGLLSGGCLENDLAERARRVIETGASSTVTYSTGGADEALWGLGVGCEGAMTILLLRVGPEEGWQPLEHLAEAHAARRPTAVGVVVDSSSPELAVGCVLIADARGPAPAATTALLELLERVRRSGCADWGRQSGASVFALPLALPPRLLLLGGGPDAAPIVDLAARLGWRVTVYDHRPAYAQASHFPAADRVILARPEAVADVIELGAFEAAVVMAHHLPTDLEYLRVLSVSPTGYVGLLGPPHRRDRLLTELGSLRTVQSSVQMRIDLSSLPEAR